MNGWRHRLTASITIAAVVGALSGCATAPAGPVTSAYPQKGQSSDQQARDMTECQNWAKQQTGFDPTTDAAKGAGVGALIGALGGAAAGAAIGAAAGSPGRGAAIGAATGGLGGAGIGGTYNYTKSKESYDQAYANCMTTRGYSAR